MPEQAVPPATSPAGAVRRVVLEVESAASLRGRWSEFFAERMGPSFDGRVILDLGCSTCSMLARVAAAHARTAFIGLDWQPGAIRRGGELIAAGGMRNVALLCGRGQDILNLFGPASLDEVWLFHPEPCDGERQRANRLFSTGFLVDVHLALGQAGSSLVLKTDHPGYYQWALGLMGLPQPEWFAPARLAWSEGRRPPAGSPKARARDIVPAGEVSPASRDVLDRFSVGAHSADYWNDAPALDQTKGRCFAGQTTDFEQRFIRKRQPIYLLELRKRPLHADRIGP